MPGGRYNAGGVDVYPVGSTVLNDQLIYQPANGGGSLGGKTFNQEVRPNFAGGLLNEGAQYNPVTNRFQPITPSGVFTADPGSAARFGEEPEEKPGGGAWTLADLMLMQSSLNQANFGNQDVESVFSNFVDAGKGTYDIDPAGGGIIGSLFFGTTADGQSVPMDKAEYKRGGRSGQPISKSLAMDTIRAALRVVDEAGGSDGSQGDM